MSEKDNGSLNNKYLFEKLLEREDKLLLIFEKMDVSIDFLGKSIDKHNIITEAHEKNTKEDHEKLKKKVEDFASIQKYFAIAFAVIILFAFGTEFIGRENIILFFEKILR